MTADIPRLRMIADPNGSGKSTIKSVLAEVVEGVTLETKTDPVPAWFKKAVWEKIKKV